MSEQETPQTPMIDPALVSQVAPTEVAAAAVGQVTRRSKQKTADELGPKEYCWGTGRRKSSIARVRLRPGSGTFMINKKQLTEFFNRLDHQSDASKPLNMVQRLDKYDVWVNVHGGGVTGQAGAIKLGVARALAAAEPELFPQLRDSGFLTRDGRMKERKKYGQKGARKRFQFSKR